MEQERPRAPGLKFRKRGRGRVAYWAPSTEAVKAGYPSGFVPLERFQDSPADLIYRCRTLQADMQLWLDEFRKDRLPFDGTIGAVLRLYQVHADSPFRTLAPGTRKPYISYLARLERHIGKRRVATVIGLDVKEWFKVWSSEGATPAAGRMAVAVLKSALKFACAAGHAAECRPLRTVLEKDVSFPATKPRTAVVTAEGVNAARRAAHEAGRPSRALCYALQFETVLRQWDVRGQWVPLSAPVLSDVVDGQDKWIGLRWEHIGADLVLRYRPSKTSGTTGAEIVADLTKCPMVLEEIALLEGTRVGPMIVHEATGRPYRESAWERGWRKDRKAAGLPTTLWNRDLRASAITEARAGNASLDDASKVAGHAKPKITGEVYDREKLEAFRRFAEARKSGRAE
jgi:integrase